MLLLILVCLNIIILGSLAKLHFYWALGGRIWIEYSVPEDFIESYNNPAHKTGIKIATLIVSFGLLFFAFVTASNYFNITDLFPVHWAKIGTRIIGSIFLIRAIGDFNYFGLFKKVNDTKFSNKDTKYFVPICLILAIASFAISFLNY